MRTPACFRRLYLVLKATVRGTPGGEPPAMSRALESLAVPLVSASPPFDSSVLSRSRRPPSPREGSRKPVEARFKEPTMILPSVSSNFLMERSAGEFDELEDLAAEPPSEE